MTNEIINAEKKFDDNKHCSICSTELKFLIKRKDKYAYYYCPDCTLVTSVPKPTPQEIIDFYNGFLYGMPGNEYFESRIKVKQSEVQRIHADIQKLKINSNPSLLDLGGGTGFYAECFRRLGYTTTLVDIDNTACDYVRKNFSGVEVINADPLNYSSDKKFDIIFANQVIEHYRDIKSFMSATKKLIKEDGIIIITTPNQQNKEFFFLPAFWRNYLAMASAQFSRLKNFLKFIYHPWICCDPPRHIFSFNKRSISRLSENEGFKIIKVFTEYSTIMYYSGKPDIVIFRRGYFRNPAKMIGYIFSTIGINFIRLIDRKNNFGENLVIFLRPEKN